MKSKKTIIFVCFFALFFLSVGFSVALLTKAPFERGWMRSRVADISWPPGEPVHLISDGRVSLEVVGLAFQTWGVWLPEASFTLVEDQARYRKLDEGPVYSRRGIVLLSAQQMTDSQVGGRTIAYFPRDGDFIFAADVMLNEAHGPHGKIYVAALIHELGHVLGLADDPAPCYSSASIMCQYLFPSGKLTPLDKSILQKRWGKGPVPASRVSGPLRKAQIDPQSP